MTILRSAAVIEAPERAVRAALVDGITWRRAARAVGGRAQAPERPLRPGDVLRMSGRARMVGGQSWTVQPESTGALTLNSADSGADLTVRLTPTDAGMLVRIDWQTTGSKWRMAPHRRRLLTFAEQFFGVLTLIAREPLLVVVAGVIVAPRSSADCGSVMAARKPGGGAEAGRWEFPGGKVRSTEAEPAALRRELSEELGIDCVVGARVGQDVDLGDGVVLRAYRVTTEDDPAPIEHDELRWLAADRLDTVEWLPADQQLLPAVAAMLDSTPGEM